MEDFKPGEEGIYFNLSSDRYHSAPGLSRSMLEQLDPPARLLAYLNKPEARDPWAVIGRVIHQRLLEPGAPLPLVTKPDTYTNAKGKKKAWSGNAKVCRKWVADQESAGNIVLGPKELEQITGVVDSMLSNEDVEMRELIQEHFSDGDAEVSCFREFEGSGVKILLKARLDFLPRRTNYIIDIKSVMEGGTSRSAIQKQLEDYLLQPAHYIQVFNALAMDNQRDDFIFFFCEKVPPYLVLPVRVSKHSEVMRLGRILWERRLAVYAECLTSRDFPGHAPSVHDIDLSDFQAKRLEQQQ